MCTPLIALRSAIENYPSTGRAGVALALHKTDEVLRKEMSGSSPGHKLGFVDAVRSLETVQNAGVDIEAVVAAFAGHFGFRLAGVAEQAETQDLNVLSAEAAKKAAAAASAIVIGAADGIVSCNDLKSGLALVMSAIDALNQAARALDARHTQDNAKREAAHV